MDREALRAYFLSFPGVSEQLQWGADLLYKIGGKMFVATNMGPEPISLSIKAHPERFDELCERAGVRPAPYLARAKWVKVDAENDLSSDELRALVAESFALVSAKLPKSKRAPAVAATKKAPTKTKKKSAKTPAKRAVKKKTSPAARRRKR